MPQATTPLIRKRFGRIETDTPYSERWVQAIKACVPSHYREWNGACWMFDPCCYLLVREITLDTFGEFGLVDLVEDAPPQFRGWLETWEVYKRRRDSSAAGGGDEGYARSYDGYGRKRYDSGDAGRERKRGPQKVDRDSFAELHLKPDAPWEVVQAAYRALARLHHPDRGGSVERMQRVNSAFEALRAKFEKAGG